MPRKNLAPLCGKPLIAWSIEQALASLAVHSVYVTTDDDEIAEVSERFGAMVIHRPAELATDTAKTEDAILHALRSIDPADYVVLLQPTSPIRQPQDIDRAIRLCIDSKSDSLFSARYIEGFTWTEGLSRWIPNYNPHNRPRRQDLNGGRVEENGSIYVFKPWVLEECNSRLGGDVACHVQHPLDSFQVNTPEDLELMEAMLPMRLGVTKPHFVSDVREWTSIESGFSVPLKRC